jgi:hypothetical protein
MPENNYIDRYNTRTVLPAVTHQEPQPSMFRNTFFGGGEEFFDTDVVEWDVVREGASMARYVNNNLEVDATEREGFETIEISTPRIQEKRVLDITTLTKRSAGETIYATTTPVDRARQTLDKDLVFCMNSNDRRTEQQCAEFMVNGRVDIIGKGVNTYVDYELPLKLTLSGTSQWGEPGTRPLQSLTYWASILRQRGYNPDTLLIDLAVADIFLQDEDYKKMLDNQRMEMGRIAPGPVTDMFETAQFFGRFNWPGLGQIDAYTYNGTYKNESNEITPYLDPYRILLLSSQARQNRILYGSEAIIEENSEKPLWVQGRYIPEIFTDRRAKTVTTIVTSRSMPAPQFDDSWWTVKVRQNG